MEAGQRERLLSREFVTVGAAAMLLFGASGASAAVLPRFIEDGLGAGTGSVGLVAGSLAVAAIFSRPVCGRLGDSRGLRLLLVLGAVVCGGGLALNALVTSVPGAVVARLLVGAGQASMMTGATTLAINLSPVSRRGEATSYILVAFHFGLGLGPLLGESLLDATSFDATWLVLGLVSVSGAAVAMLLPRRPVVRHEDAPANRLFHPAAIPPGLVMGLGILGSSGFNAYTVPFTEYIGMGRAAPVFFITSATIAFVRIVGGRVPDRLGPVRGATVAMTSMTFALLLLAAWQAKNGLFLCTFLNAAGAAMFFPSMIPAAVAGVPESQRASAMATFTMFLDTGPAIGPLVFGAVLSATNYPTACVFGAGTTVLGLAYLHVIVAPRIRGRALVHVDEVETVARIDEPI